jgi:Tfp pilus assembly protein PilO
MADITKRALIDKANVTVVAVVSIAAFVTIFSLVATKALWNQRSYQSRVIAARTKARDQLDANKKAADSLVSSYQQFVSEQQNVIGGSATGSGERDGDNARIVLDSLPSKYDFPALATSLEKLVKGQSLIMSAISGVDDESNQQKQSSSATPQPVEMPFKVGVKGSYDNIQKFVGVLENSIRPFNVNQFELKASENGDLELTLDAKTYYQPELNFEFKSEVIK